MKIGYVGLGKMGKNMVLRLMEKGFEVVVWNRSADDVEEVSKKGAVASTDFKDLSLKLPTPRIIWLMLPSGTPTEENFGKLLPLLSKGDLVVDGSNSYYKDSVARAKKAKEAGVGYLDAGVSGGPKGARNGACIMVGGEKQEFEKAELVFKAAAADWAYELVGESGAGHFAKMVHNGIEYGMMQSIAEGAAVLKKSDYKFNLAKLFKLYESRSVIQSRLVRWATDAFYEDVNLTSVSSKIEATGEGEWTIKTAEELGIDVPIIKESLEVRKRSASNSNNFRDKVVSALRGKFGGHKVSN